MSMMLDNWDKALGIGSIVFIVVFVWFAFRKGMRVRVNEDDTRNNSNM